MQGLREGAEGYMSYVSKRRDKKQGDKKRGRRKRVSVGNIM